VLRERHQFFRTILMGADATFIAASQVLAYMVRFEWFDHIFEKTVERHTYRGNSIPLILLPLMVGALFYMGLYEPRRDQRFAKEMRVIIRSVLLGTLLIMAGFYALKQEAFGGIDRSRWQFAIFGGLCAASLISWRFTFRSFLRALRRRGWNLRHVAIIGTGRLGQVVCRTLNRNSWTGIRPAYFISHLEDSQRTECCGLPVAGGFKDAERILDEREVAGVFVALPQRMAAELPTLLRKLERHAIDVRIVPDVQPRYTPFSMATTELEGMPVLSLRQGPMNGWGGLMKRLVDFVGAVALIILFSPLMLLIAIVLRLSGPGPVIFRQPRASLGGRTFKIYKFRTMKHVDVEQQSIEDAGKGTEAWTDWNDPRITRVGRILRRTSLDELPQFFNVLLGEMSLVGPRPERPELIARFREDWRGYMLRQHVKAGITGWAQVNGLRGKTSLRKRVQYDLFYIRNWSLLFDLRILWMTLFRGFAGPNAH
jgi:Undecaprenyl-phosphate glucose phosphotransferase